MAKIISGLAENLPWLERVSTINYLIFISLFIVIVISVLRMKKSQVEEYKNFPLDDDNADNYHQKKTL